ncbi:hypothetical protein LFZ92_13360 [Salmonella enterica subsp. salamae serovar 57:z29:z42]|nr:hypothetical protein LFZ92_13360 [Salmonella enterica subsp. salamae serovar 57:z29:z42]ECC1660408.1 hypothetical protein [Salmonella enterica subsp. salamae]ECI0415872.1 hypothetical protein [Salmonella enterica subsp. salamae]EDW4021220.1 hypothetical protein [Salmonella enterica subsp. salamae]
MLLLIYGAFKHLQYRSGIQLSPLCRIDKTRNNSPLSLPMRLLPESYFYYRSPLSFIKVTGSTVPSNFYRFEF